jgi:hypothetical protein
LCVSKSHSSYGNNTRTYRGHTPACGNQTRAYGHHTRVCGNHMNNKDLHLKSVKGQNIWYQNLSSFRLTLISNPKVLEKDLEYFDKNEDHKLFENPAKTNYLEIFLFLSTKN